jgi:hypothetical protein
MRIDLNGNVGIGTTSPTSLLELKQSNLPRITLLKTGILSWYVGNPTQGTSNNFSIGTDSGGNTEILTLTNTGNVGIGTTSPAYKFDLNSNAGGISFKTYTSTTNNTEHTYSKDAGFFIDSYQSVGGPPYTKTTDLIANADAGADSQLRLFTATTGGNPAERMRITSGGNLLLGTTTDSGFKLDVSGTGRFSGNTTGAIATFVNTNTAGTGNGILVDVNSQSGTDNYVMNLISNGTSRMYVREDGNVGIGTTSPQRTLHISGGTGTEFELTNTAMASGAKNFNIWGYPVDGTWNIRTLSDDSNAQSVNFVSFVASTGAATFSSSVTATGFFVSSDITLKSLTQDKFDASKIDAISYKWKTDLNGKTHVGYSAQDVQQYMPDAVNKDNNGQLSVDYIQVLVQKIAHLENKLKEHGLD